MSWTSDEFSARSSCGRLFTAVCLLLGAVIFPALQPALSETPARPTNLRLKEISPFTLLSPQQQVWEQPGPVQFEVDLKGFKPGYLFVDWNNTLEAWWRFDPPASAGPLFDWSGNGHHGTARAGAGSVQPGRIGSAFSFNGQSSVLVADPISWNDNDSFTLAVWAKATDNGRHKNILVGTATGVTYRWYIHVGAVQYLALQDSSMEGPQYWSSRERISYQNYHHLALVFDRSAGSLTFFLDGKSDTVYYLTAPLRAIDITQLEIGGGYSGFSGELDEFLVFRRALKPEEIEALYDLEQDRFVTNFSAVDQLSSYPYRIIGVSSDGIKTETAQRQIIIDTPDSVPSVELVHPLNNTRLSASSQNFEFVAKSTNRDSSLKQATLYLGEVDNLQPVSSIQLTGTSAEALFVREGLTEGELSWNVLVEDSRGNRAFAAPPATFSVGMTQYHVAKSGSDSNPGSASQPFLTVQKCASSARPGDSCVIHAGVYRETVKPASSGYPRAPVVFRAAEGEEVVISGADPVTGWELDSGSIFRSRLDWDLGLGKNQVFVDDQMVLEARHPNAAALMQQINPKFSIASGTVSGKNVTLNDPVNLTQAAGYWEGALVHATWNPRYHAATGTVIESAPGVLKIELHCSPHGDINQYGIYHLQGHINALDQANEWFFDSTERVLYLWPPGDLNPNQLRVEAKRRDYAFDLRALSHIKINGIRLHAATIIMDPDSHFNQIDNLKAHYISHYTVIDQSGMGSGYKGVRDTGIIIDGTHNTLSNCEIGYSAGNGVALLGRNNAVEYCEIHHVNYAVTEAAAVQLGERITYDNRISHSNLHRAGRSIISHSGARRLKILHNQIHHSRYGGEAWDLGGTYSIMTDGQGTEIAYNHLHTLVSLGIYLDLGSWNYHIHHNLVEKENYSWFLGLLINENNGNHRVHHNTILGRAFLDTLPNYPTYGHSVKNNIFGRFAFRDGHNWVTPKPEQAVVSNNLELELLDSQVLSNVFVDQAGKNFRLSASSIALDAGLDLNYDKDLDNQPRFSGSAPDQGAYEYQK